MFMVGTHFADQSTAAGTDCGKQMEMVGPNWMLQRETDEWGTRERGRMKVEHLRMRVDCQFSTLCRRNDDATHKKGQGCTSN